MNQAAITAQTSQFRTRAGGRLVALAGSTPNVGTTIVAFGLAHLLAKATGLKVGYLCLNLKSSKLHRYMDRDGQSFALGELRAELKTGTLRAQRLLHACEPMGSANNLYVLYGNTQRELADLYMAQEVAHLMETARAAFDVCFIDLNAYWDNAATVCGMQLADDRLIVTTGDMGHFQEDIGRWINGVGAALGFAPEHFSLIVTQMDRGSTEDGLNMRDIAKETGMNVSGKIGKFGDVLTYANQGRLLDLLNGVHPLQKQLFCIVQELSRRHGIALTADRKHKRWFRKMLDGAAAAY